MSAEVWYLDTSAFVKLVRHEDETDALIGWLNDRRRCSSDLLRTEARRAVQQEPAEARTLVERLLASLPLVRLSPDVFDRAGQLPGSALRSLDALHLAAARTLGPDLAGIVTYDDRLAGAAGALGVPTARPSSAST
jgi:uncharacterized protein